MMFVGFCIWSGLRNKNAEKKRREEEEAGLLTPVEMVEDEGASRAKAD
jgi:hypothetical protein